MKRDQKQRLKAILTSDLTSEAMVIWTYLTHVLPQGAGQPHLDKTFGSTDIGWREAVDILMELELLEQAELARGGFVYRAKAPDVIKGRMSSEPVPTLSGAIAVLAERYQVWREDNGFRRWTPTPADERKWTTFLAWIRLHKVDLKEYCDFALALYKNIPGVSIPGPAHLAGPYAQSNWLNRDSAGPSVAKATKRKLHAGSAYRPAKAIRRRLEELGVESGVMDGPQCRYVDDLAQASVLDAATPVPTRWREAVTALMGDYRAPPA